MEEMPRIGLGTWKSPNSDVLKHAIIYAVETCGYRHIDCAAVYGNEKIVGDALKDLFSRNVIKREEIWITSKLWNTDHRAERVEAACRRTLNDLGLTYLDLYLMHSPAAFIVTEDEKFFPLDANGAPITEKIPIINTWIAMEKLVDSGLTKRIGVSNFTINMLEKLRYNENAKIQPFSNQIEHHLYMQQGPMLKYLNERGIILTSYSTLGSNDFKKADLPTVLEDEVLNQIANEVGKTPAHIALKFLLQMSPSIVVLAKSVTPERIKSNIELDFELNEDQMQRLYKRERCIRMLDYRQLWKMDLQADGW